MEIIPAIDIINASCVRLEQGNYDKKTVYFKDPLDAAKAFEDAGYKRLHLVDLDGAKSGGIKNLDMLSAIAGKTSLSVQFSGGLKDSDGVKRAFEAGAVRISVGSIAVTNTHLFQEWLYEYGNDKVLLSADSMNGKIATRGWLNHSDKDVKSFIQEYASYGVSTVICTDISRDGMLSGPAVGLYESILADIPVELIASGGVGSVDDLKKLTEVGCTAVIVGRAFYEGKIPLSVQEDAW